jgi:glycosyltransferase involved in cell wall biosynthesis
MKIGYAKSDYLHKRNILGKIPDNEYVMINDIYKIIRYTGDYLNKIIPKKLYINTYDLTYRFNDLGLFRVDLVHFFNTISFSNTPWITTFETIVPRYNLTRSCHHGRKCGYSALSGDKNILRALDAISGNSCRKLVAMSECSLNMQKEFLSEFPHYYSAINSKLIYMHPPQEILFDNIELKQLSANGPIHFMFVGSSFFRKGGMEILEAFKESRDRYGHNIKLTIISSLIIDDYATKETQRDVEIAKDIIYSNNDWIEYYEYLPNDKVVKLMRTAHVGLLPTYAETYGFSVLEFQASGCPVVSTNVRALPEINDDIKGWVIEIPKNRLGEALYTTEEERAEVRDVIKSGLLSIIDEIMDNRQIILRKAKAALKHIQDNHSPADYSIKLGKIYYQVLN